MSGDDEFQTGYVRSTDEGNRRIIILTKHTHYMGNIYNTHILLYII